MITCAITAESKRALRKAIGIILTKRINQKSKFDLKDITKDVYDIIFTATSEHAQGLNYARLVPEIILQLRNHDTDVKTYLRGSLDAVGDIQYEFEKEDGLKAVEDFLGVNIDIPGVLKSEQPRYTSEEEREAAPKQEPLTPEDFTPTSFQKGDRVKINDEIGGEANVIEDRGNEVLLDNGRPPILKKNLELILPEEVEQVVENTNDLTAKDITINTKSFDFVDENGTTRKAYKVSVKNQPNLSLVTYAKDGGWIVIETTTKRALPLTLFSYHRADARKHVPEGLAYELNLRSKQESARPVLESIGYIYPAEPAISEQGVTTQGVLQPTEKGSVDDLQGKGRTEPILTQPTPFKYLKI